jgi:hypothetical protein
LLSIIILLFLCVQKSKQKRLKGRAQISALKSNVCGKTQRKLVEEGGLYCNRELETYVFVVGEIESEASKYNQQTKKEMHHIAENDPELASLLWTTRQPNIHIDGGAGSSESHSDDIKRRCLASETRDSAGNQNTKSTNMSSYVTLLLVILVY